MLGENAGEWGCSLRSQQDRPVNPAGRHLAVVVWRIKEAVIRLSLVFHEVHMGCTNTILCVFLCIFLFVMDILSCEFTTSLVGKRQDEGGQLVT